MKKQRRLFSTEFKHDVACLVVDREYSGAETSRFLDVEENVLRRWVNQSRAKCEGITPSSKAMTHDQQRIKELETRISRLAGDRPY